MAKQKLFTKSIDDMLFAQYKFGSDFDKQKVVCKIFNPYGDGTWYILNSDPEDPDYMWAIVKMFGNVEVGSVSRSELQSISFFGLNLGLERDISFTPTNAKQVYDGLLKGEHFDDGGEMELGKLIATWQGYNIYDKGEKPKYAYRYYMRHKIIDPPYKRGIVVANGNTIEGTIRNYIENYNYPFKGKITYIDLRKKHKPSRITDSMNYANGGEITLFDDFMRAFREDYDDMDNYLAAFSSLEEAKQFAINNKHKYGVIVFLDAYGDSIYVDKNDTKEDIDFLFSTEFANGGKFGEDFGYHVINDEVTLKDGRKLYLTKGRYYWSNELGDDRPSGIYYVTKDGKFISSEMINFPIHAKGGKIGFKGLADKVAARYKGTKVPAKYQSEYGKTYDAAEAQEVGKKVAAKVYRQQLAKKKFALGGNTSDQPKIYVEELIAHKEGLDDGEWIILTDYNDGDEIMDAINDLLEEWSEKYGEERDEYIVTAYENFSDEYYDKFMDETQFDEILEEFNKGGNLEEISEEKDIPVEVLEQIVADFDPDDLSEWIDDNYYGYFNSERELAEEYVQSIGGLSQLSPNTLEYHFDYDGFGSDLASDYSEYDGYYFRSYKQGGVMPKHDLKKYLKKKVKTNTA